MKKRLNFQLGVTALLTIVGCALLIAGFCVPPIGIIDNSVLIAFGEILTFVGAVFGVNYSYKVQLYKFRERDRGNENNA